MGQGSEIEPAARSGPALQFSSLLLPALILALPLACQVTPEELTPAPDRLPRPEVTVSGSEGDRPFSITAACLPFSGEDFEAALSRIGAGLRISGRRGDLVIRRASLSTEEAALLMTSLGLEGDDFSTRRDFAWGDRIIVRSMVDGPPQIGFYLHLVPWIRPDDRIFLDTSAVARPPDGSLLPVLRADVDVDGPGPVLLVGEANGSPAFAVMLDLDVPGLGPAGPSRDSAPRAHDLRVTPYAVDSDALTALLTGSGLSEGGDVSGVAFHRIRERDLDALANALEQAGKRETPLARTVPSGGTVLVNTGTLRVEARTEFSIRDFSYRTRLSLMNREGSRPQWTSHGERDAVLMVSWDAEGPGDSRALLVQVRPVD